MENSFPQEQTLVSFSRRVGGSLTLRLLLLWSLQLIATFFVSYFALRFESTGGLMWLCVASGMCMVTGGLMLVFDAVGGASPLHEVVARQGLMQSAFGFLFRMGVPLLVCAFVAIQLGKPSAQSLARYLLVIYPLGLFGETLLSVTRRQVGNQPGGSNSTASRILDLG